MDDSKLDTNSGSSGGNGINGGGRSRSRDKPPKLPPREHSAAAIYGPALWAKPGDGGGGKAGVGGGGMGGKMSGEGGRTKTGNEKKGGGEREI